MTPQQAANTKPVPDAQKLLLSNHREDSENVLNQLSYEQKETCVIWSYPTQETCADPTKLKRIQGRTYDQIITLLGKEQVETKKTVGQGKKIYQSTTDKNHYTMRTKTRVEHLLVKFCSIFAKQPSDIGTNTEFKLKLTAQPEKLVYSQSLMTPTILREDFLVELAPMQEYGTMNTFPFSKYSSTFFAQRKPNDKLRISIDLRQCKHLIKHDYREHKNPMTTSSDAAQHLARRSTSVN